MSIRTQRIESLFNTPIVINASIQPLNVSTQKIECETLKSKDASIEALVTNTMSLPFATFNASATRMYNNVILPNQIRTHQLDTHDLHTFKINTSHLHSLQLESNHILCSQASMDTCEIQHLKSNHLDIECESLTLSGLKLAERLEVDVLTRFSKDVSIPILNTNAITTRCINAMDLHVKTIQVEEGTVASMYMDKVISSQLQIQTPMIAWEETQVRPTSWKTKGRFTIDASSVYLPPTTLSKLTCTQIQSQDMSVDRLTIERMECQPSFIFSPVPCFTLKGMDTLQLDASFVSIPGLVCSNDEIKTTCPLSSDIIQASSITCSQMKVEAGEFNHINTKTFKALQMYSEEVYSTQIEAGHMSVDTLTLHEVPLTMKEGVLKLPPIHTLQAQVDTIQTSKGHIESLTSDTLTVIHTTFMGGDVYIKGTLYAQGESRVVASDHLTMKHLELQSSALYPNGMYFKRDVQDVIQDVPAHEYILDESTHSSVLIIKASGDALISVGDILKFSGMWCNGQIKTVVSVQDDKVTLDPPFTYETRVMKGDKMSVYNQQRIGIEWDPRIRRLECTPYMQTHLCHKLYSVSNRKKWMDLTHLEGIRVELPKQNRRYDLWKSDHWRVPSELQSCLDIKKMNLFIQNLDSFYIQQFS